MQNIFFSTRKLNLYLILSSDPNIPRENFIRLSGVKSNIQRFAITLRNKALKVVFFQQYSNMNVSTASLLEFFTYLPKGEYVVDLEVDEQIQSLKVSL